MNLSQCATCHRIDNCKVYKNRINKPVITLDIESNNEESSDLIPIPDPILDRGIHEKTRV